MPSYIQWVMGLDRHAMFEDLRRMLQYLQWQHFRGMKRRWILKTPGLLGTEAVLAETFPGTDFIVTHRHPTKTLPSTAALFCGTLEMYNAAVDKSCWSRDARQFLVSTVQQHLEWRAHYPTAKVRDVRFDDIVNRDFEVLASLYEFLGLPFYRSYSHQRQQLAGPRCCASRTFPSVYPG